MGCLPFRGGCAGICAHRRRHSSHFFLHTLVGSRPVGVEVKNSRMDAEKKKTITKQQWSVRSLHQITAEAGSRDIGVGSIKHCNVGGCVCLVGREKWSSAPRVCGRTRERQIKIIIDDEGPSSKQNKMLRESFCFCTYPFCFCTYPTDTKEQGGRQNPRDRQQTR